MFLAQSLSAILLALLLLDSSHGGGRVDGGVVTISAGNPPKTTVSAVRQVVRGGFPRHVAHPLQYRQSAQSGLQAVRHYGGGAEDGGGGGSFSSSEEESDDEETQNYPPPTHKRGLKRPFKGSFSFWARRRQELERIFDSNAQESINGTINDWIRATTARPELRSIASLVASLVSSIAESGSKVRDMYCQLPDYIFALPGKPSSNNEKDALPNMSCNTFLTDMKLHPRLASLLVYAMFVNHALMVLTFPEANELLIMHLSESRLLVPARLSRDPQFLAFLTYFSAILDPTVVSSYMIEMQGLSQHLNDILVDLHSNISVNANTQLMQDFTHDTGNVLFSMLDALVILIERVERLYQDGLSHETRSKISDMRVLFRANLMDIERDNIASRVTVSCENLMMIGSRSTMKLMEFSNLAPLEHVVEVSSEYFRTMVATLVHPSRLHRWANQQWKTFQVSYVLSKYPYLIDRLNAVHFYREAMVYSLMPGLLGEAFLLGGSNQNQLDLFTNRPSAIDHYYRRQGNHPRMDLFLELMKEKLQVLARKQRRPYDPFLVQKCLLISFGQAEEELKHGLTWANIPDNPKRPPIASTTLEEVVKFALMASKDMREVVMLVPELQGLKEARCPREYLQMIRDAFMTDFQYW